MKNVIQGTTLSGTGSVSIAPGAEITIRNPAGQLVPLWVDRAGTQPADNPFLTDNEGNFRVYADSGWVHVRAQKDGSVREWRYVPIGSAAAMDIGEVYAALGSEIYSSVSEGLSNSAEGDYFLVESSGSLDLYRVVNGVAEQRELGIEADALLATRAYADGVAAEAESNATNAAVAAASSAYQQATEYSDSELQTHRESGDHDGRYYTKTEVDQALDDKVDESDPRLSDSREWTAETVSQAEAEAGTSTTRRAWTAQRVRQAAEAAVAGGGGSVTWDDVGTDPEQVPTNEMLGTAAWADLASEGGTVPEVNRSNIWTSSNRFASTGTVASFRPENFGSYIDLVVTPVSDLTYNLNWPPAGTHAIQWRVSGSSTDENVRGVAFTAYDATNLLSLSLDGAAMGEPDGGFMGAGTLNAEELYDSGQRVGEIRARVTSLGNVDYSSNALTSSLTVSHTDTGEYLVTHNLGTTNYVVSVIPEFPMRFASVRSRASNSVFLEFYGFSGSLSDNAFLVTISLAH